MRPRLVVLAALAVLCATRAGAQDIAINLGGGVAGQSVLLFAAVTLLSLAPGIAVMVTCFPFIVTVLSILRQAIGVQQAPPNMLIVSLALFLTWYVMEPTLLTSWREGVSPLVDGTLDPATAFERAVAPFRTFMSLRADPDTIARLAELRAPEVPLDPAAPPLSILVPGFMLSEIARAFQVGFLIFLPFLVIDMVVSAVLMSMGMMMVPPAMVALPFKLAFFVVADGWTLVAEALVRSYG